MHQCVESSVWAVYSHSAVGINCCNCPSSTVRRTVPQNSAIGSTCVCVKSLKFDAITNEAKSRHSPIRSRKIPSTDVSCPDPTRICSPCKPCIAILATVLSTKIACACLTVRGSTFSGNGKTWQVYNTANAKSFQQYVGSKSARKSCLLRS